MRTGRGDSFLKAYEHITHGYCVLLLSATTCFALLLLTGSPFWSLLRARPEVIVVGLKAVREVCVRCPLIMSSELLQVGHLLRVAISSAGAA